MSDEGEDAGYLRCIEALQREAIRWCSLHPFAELRFRTREFEAEVAVAAGRAAHEKPAIVAQLSDVIDRWAGNADTRAFLRAIDEATGQHATYLMMRALVDQQRERQIERGQGELPEGDWACPHCQHPGGAYTQLDGVARVPRPGAVGVCGYCSGLTQVSASGRAYEALSTAAFNQLPTAQRKVLRQAQHAVDEARKDREARS